MNQKVIKGEEIFQVLAHSMTIGYSSSGYTLNYSSDGTNFTAWSDATSANEVCIVNDFAKGTYFKLAGNTDNNVIITF